MAVESSWFRPLIQTLLFVFLLMTAFEWTKQLMHPDITIWESHVVTIVFSGGAATSVAFWILRRERKVISQLLQEITERERVERELARTHEELDERVRRRTLELEQANAALLAESTARRQAEDARQRVILEERTRMAREIHDTLAQSFSGIALQLEAADDVLLTEPTTAQWHLLQASALAREGLMEARRSVWALRSPVLDQGDFVEAVKNMVAQLVANMPLQVHVSAIGDMPSLPMDVEEHLLRICREALCNVIKHAQAQQVHVQLHGTPLQVQLRVQDDGKGFDPCRSYHSGFGLISMRERAERIGATLTITSQPKGGTTVRLVSPVSAQVTPPTLHD